MTKKNKKLYYVSREVFASSITAAMKEHGTVYSVVMATEEKQPIPSKENLGFNKTKK